MFDFKVKIRAADVEVQRNESKIRSMGSISAGQHSVAQTLRRVSLMTV